MVNERYGLAISETLYYLKGIQQQDIDRIPNKLMSFLKDNSLKNYKCNFDYTRPLKELNISDEARGLIAMICLNFWCDNDEKKEMFKKHLTENELKYQEELKEKYNPNNLFKNIREKNIKMEYTEMIEYKECKWYKKIFSKIINIFRKQ